MEAIFEFLAILNDAIESGTMTQVAMATATLSIAERLHIEWEAGNLSSSILLRADEEIRFLGKRWKEHLQAGKVRSKSPRSKAHLRLVDCFVERR